MSAAESNVKAKSQMTAKLRKAAAKGVLETSLLGKGGDSARGALRELEGDGLLVKKTGKDAVIFCFAAEHAPPSALESLTRLVQAASADKGPVLWKEAGLKGALLKSKHYTHREVDAAVNDFCHGSQMLAVKDGKTTKYLSCHSIGSPTGDCGGPTTKDYFVSEAARVIYSLVELDGQSRQHALGLTPSHYRDPDLAKSWRNDLARIIHPDVCRHPKAHAAAIELDRLYREMTG